jgi:acetyltransferase-like isoleucine patch superfamily enzyme
VRFTVVPGSDSVIRIGARCIVGDDVRIDLRGGELLFGDDVDVRHQCVLGVGGRMELRGPNLVQHGCTVHCDEAVTLGPFATLGECVSIIDSSHVFDGPSEWFVDDVRTAPVVLEAHAWVAAKATVARGVRLGEASVVGANSLAVKDIPAGYLASGVPARVVRAVLGHDSDVYPAAPGPPSQGGGPQTVQHAPTGPLNVPQRAH